MPQFPLSPKKSNNCSIAITQHKLSHHNGFQKHQPLNFFEELFSGYYSYHIQYQIFFIRNSAAEFSLRLLNQNVLFRLNVVKGLIKINKICPRLSGLFWQQLSFHVRKFSFEKTFCFEYRMSPGLIYANISLVASPFLIFNLSNVFSVAYVYVKISNASLRKSPIYKKQGLFTRKICI